MKTPLLPALTLTLALACLPAIAQLAPSQTVELSPPDASPGAGAPGKSSPASPILRNPVALNASTVGEVIEYLNEMLAEQKASLLNVVVVPDVENVKVPAMTLQNVTATDVLNVVTKVAGLSLEPVPSDSGKVVAWIITKRITGVIMEGGGIGTFGGSEGGPAGGGGTVLSLQDGAQDQSGIQISGAELTITNGSAPPQHLPGQTATVKSGITLTPSIAGTSGAAQWVDPAPLTPAPAQVSRVLGIGKIYEDSPNQDERAKKEEDLAAMLSSVAEDQNLKCKVQLYHGLHVIVLKGTPDAVALVEQTVAAMKENVGVKKPAAPAGTGLKPF